MTRRRHGGLGSIVVAALLLLAAPAPAAADYSIVWWPARCATGEFTQYTVDTSRQPGPALRISGWIQPCAETTVTNGFAIMYHTRAANYILRPVPYETLAAPTEFIWEISALPEVHADGLRGLCLARSYERWLSCVSVEWGSAGIPHMTPVPPSDPGLQAPVNSGGAISGWRCTHAGCGSCVDRVG
jgi:hypothetical protein